MPTPDASSARPPRLLVGAVAVAAFYGLLFALAPTSQPVLMPDSAGYLAVGRWLSGAGEVPQQLGVLYSWAYGIFYTVPYLFSDRVGWVYAWGVGSNIFAGAALFLTLAALLRRRWPEQPVGLVGLIAFAGAAWSGVALQVGQVWPELPLAVMTAVWVLALQRLADGVRRAPVELALAAVALVMLHHRMVGVVVVTALILLRPPRDRRALGVLAGLVAGCVLAAVVDRIVVAGIYPRGASGFALQNVVHHLGPFVRILVGELWYVAAATVGIALLVGIGRDERDRLRNRALLAAFGLTALLGAVQLAASLGRGVPLRADFLVYGRYVTPFVPVLIVLGAAELLLARRARPIVAVVGCVVASAAELALNGNYSQPAYTPFHSLGLLSRGLKAFPLDVLTPSLWAVGLAATLVAAAPRLRPQLAAAALAALVAIGSGVGANKLNRLLTGADSAGRDLVTAVDRLPPAAVMRVDPSAGSSTFVLLQLLRPDRRFVYGTVGTGTQHAWVVHGLQWKAPRGLRVRLLSAPGQFQSVSCLGPRC